MDASAGARTRTKRIRLGTLVTNISMHNPAVLAKQALTVDHVSGGRLELGIGAGGAPEGYTMTVIPDWNPTERAARLREFVEILDQMLRNEVTTYQGHYYRVENSEMHPAPIQKPRPPLTVAALGPKSLRIGRGTPPPGTPWPIQVNRFSESSKLPASATLCSTSTARR